MSDIEDGEAAAGSCRTAIAPIVDTLSITRKDRPWHRIDANEQSAEAEAPHALLLLRTNWLVLADPTSLTVGPRTEVTRTWWCHLACFEAALPDMAEPWSSYTYEDEAGVPFNW